LSLAREPGKANAAVEEQGSIVCVDDDVIPLLDDKALDGRTEGDQVTFGFVGGGGDDPGAAGTGS
jgi:hypothetical protein